MTMKTGIWIDHKQAVVVLLTDAGEAVQKIALEEDKPASGPGVTRSKNKYTPNDFVAEDRLERKSDSALKNYFDRVLACVQGADAMLVLGPGLAKGEFQKRIAAKKLKGVTVEVETADKLTDPQIVAKVQKHFAASFSKKKAAPKKTATKSVKKAAKAPAKKGKKNGRK